MEFGVLGDYRARLGESPFWSDEDAALYFVDVHEGNLLRWSDVDGTQCAKVAERLPFVLPARDGGLILGLRHGVATLDRPFEQGALDLAPELGVQQDMPTISVNDCRMDANGRLWFGTMERQDRAPLGHIYSWSPTEGLVSREKGVTLSNGMQFSPDDKKLYFVDSWLQSLDVFDVDLTTGVLSNRRTLASIPEPDGMPDGIDVDAEGYIYVALYGGGRVHRYAHDGTLDRVIAMPVTNPTSCTFGGEDLRTLFITSANAGKTNAGPLRESATLIEPDRALEGAVLTLRVDVPGRGSPKFPHALETLRG